MSELRFNISSEIIPVPLLKKAYFAGWGRTPRPTQTTFEDGVLTVRSESKSSGTINVLWPNRELGVIMESTDSLLFRERNYCLIKELTRGALGRLLRKLFEWQVLGFRQPPELAQRIFDASRQFSKVVVAEESDPEIERELAGILRELDRISMEMTMKFTEQSLAWRMRSNEKLPIYFGIGMNRHPIGSLYEFDLYAHFLQEAFHAVLPMPSWRELEPAPGQFCWELLEGRIACPARFGFEIVLGPLLCFDLSTFPTWLLPYLNQEGIFETHATRFVNALAERYGSLVKSWILTSRVNSYSIAELPQTRTIALVRMLAQQLRSRGIEMPILVGIDQPWGEYALRKTPDFDLIQIAESLMGCHEIDAFLVEMNFGLDDHSTFPRDPMAVSAMIDQWSYLGKKVYVSLSVPSAAGGSVADIDRSLAPELQWSEGLQQFWTETLLMTILGKRMVQGIFWSPLQDREESPEDTKLLDLPSSPFGGLIDSNRVLKLAFKHFVAMRKTVVK